MMITQQRDCKTELKNHNLKVTSLEILLRNGSKAKNHHFICESYGAIKDISDCYIDECKKEILKKKKSLIKRHSLEFFELCEDCHI